MPKFLDEKFFKLLTVAFLAGGGWYKLNTLEEKIDLKINEVKAFINGDNKAGEIRISRLETDNARHENQIVMMGTTVAILQKELDYSDIKRK